MTAADGVGRLGIAWHDSGWQHLEASLTISLVRTAVDQYLHFSALPPFCDCQVIPSVLLVGDVAQKQERAAAAVHLLRSSRSPPLQVEQLEDEALVVCWINENLLCFNPRPLAAAGVKLRSRAAASRPAVLCDRSCVPRTWPGCRLLCCLPACTPVAA